MPSVTRHPTGGAPRSSNPPSGTPNTLLVTPKIPVTPGGPIPPRRGDPEVGSLTGPDMGLSEVYSAPPAAPLLLQYSP